MAAAALLSPCGRVELVSHTLGELDDVAELLQVSRALSRNERRETSPQRTAVVDTTHARATPLLLYLCRCLCLQGPLHTINIQAQHQCCRLYCSARPPQLAEVRGVPLGSGPG